MGGFKSGAADDDWGSTEANDETESTAEDDIDAEGTTESTSGNKSDAVDKPDTAIQSKTGTRQTERVSQTPQRDLPWVLTRGSITDGREQTVQLHLQQSTVDTQRETMRTLESALGEPVKKADLREAALLVGLRHGDEIAATLREWGYDLD